MKEFLIFAVILVAALLLLKYLIGFLFWIVLGALVIIAIIKWCFDEDL